MNYDDIYGLKGHLLDNAVSEIVLEWHVEERDNGYGYPAKYWIDKHGVITEPFNFWNPAWRIEHAMVIANLLGIALIPQSQEDGTFHWFALDVESVHYRGEEIALRELNDSGISTDRPSESICKAAIYSKLSNSRRSENETK